jgi:SAM-dependent methyltransferase
MPSADNVAPQVVIHSCVRPRLPFGWCPLCESKDMKLLCSANCSKHPLYDPIIPPVINWMQCRDCEHVFTDGIFSDEAKAVIFAKTNENQKPGLNFEQQRYVSARMVEKVAQYTNSGLWLDVGFGNGSLLFTAEEWGFKPVGLDMRSSSVEAMRRLGFEAHCVDLASFEAQTRCSVISMADVLEHMPFPKAGLEAAKRLLLPGGVLFLSMPNYNCATWRLLDAARANPYWGEIEHYHNFSRQRLYSLLEEMQFEPINYGISQRYRVCMEIIARHK